MGPFDLVTNDPALRRGDQAGEFVEQGRRGLIVGHITKGTNNHDG
ncbi:hypothetical protein [Cutibacterium acnes]|jgi:hypothetical protein|nr:hypothetical protein [Cutibacterium acnes]MDU7288250.1 hypothetical protein [Corynebacterium kroppenstedtii]AGJ81061.1 hypothetical protein PAGK_2329 [Cutibacterium acnes HL096PA1]EFT68777.1 hypothetical protein HMPREF9583_00916 [Cutibacterium acnes HL038PA1]EGE71900.1 hypothetical protein HMPREF9338_01182 [Cutibacterium acnes HL096PA2]EGE75374.1 hypothetical protein HMPREF9344_01291 [Cutibacterium acnes HL097PA1]